MLAPSKITKAALALPPAKKAQLVERLLASLADPKHAEIDASWGAEAEDRLRAYDTGKMTAVAAEDVFREIRARRK